MSTIDIKPILIAARTAILAEMREIGFYYRTELMFTPTFWDINNGWCEEFAIAVEKIMDESRNGYYWNWFEDYEHGAHAVIVYDGKYYDAQCIEGVNDWKKLPFYKQISREQWIAEQFSLEIKGIIDNWYTNCPKSLKFVQATIDVYNKYFPKSKGNEQVDNN
jgi:hypothetical protein